MPVADVDDDLRALVAHGWLAHEALVVVERSGRGAGPDWPEGIVADRSRSYGETTLWYGHATR